MNTPDPNQPRPGGPLPPHLAAQQNQENAQQPPHQPSQPQPVYPQPVQPQPVYPQNAHPAQPAYPQAQPPQPVHPQAQAPTSQTPPGPPGHSQPQPPQPVYPQAAPPQPIPAQPIPAQPIPAQPIPAQPIPTQPIPARPTPPQPIPTRPASAQPVAPMPPAAPTPHGSSGPPTPATPVSPGGHVPQPLRPQPIPTQPASGDPRRPIPAPANRPIPAPSKPVDEIKPVVPDEEADDDEDDEESEDIAGEVIKGSPPWLVSLFVHAGLLVVLALLVLTTQPEPRIEMEVVYAEKEGEQLEDDSLDMFSPDPMDLEEPIFSKDITQVEDPFAAPPDIPTVSEAQFDTSTMDAPSVGLALSGREKGAKSALLAAYGGTATTEAAVANALKWLAKQQKSDGTWSLVGPYADGAIAENIPAATAMAMLAFQGAGNTHQRGQYKGVVAKGKDALLKLMDADGTFFIKGNVNRHNHKLYTQAQCSIALIELYGMSRDPALKGKAQLALDYAARIQASEGGWRYRPNSDSDTSVTGWFVMALQSGLMSSDLEVKDETLKRVSKYLDAAQSHSGARYAYQPGEGPTLAMTAEGLLCRQYLGWPRDHSSLRRGVDFLLANNINSSQRDVYYWYYSTQVLHHMGGDDWDKWNNVMREVVPASQVDSGPEAGSWNPGRDAWGGHGGRLYVTCLSTYMLEVYYRHLPIYKHF